MNGVAIDGQVIMTKPFSDKTGLTFYPDSVMFNALAADVPESGPVIEKETTFDFQAAYAVKLNGVRVMLKNQKWGDYAYMTIWLPYAEKWTKTGAPTVYSNPNDETYTHVNTPGEDMLLRVGGKYRFSDEKQDQGWIGASYDSHIVAGLKLRIHYVTTQTSGPVEVIVDFNMHKVV